MSINTRKPTVVISGISGKFPKCNDFAELEENIFSEKDLITNNPYNWPADGDMPYFIGAYKDNTKFDDTYFGVHRNLSSVMDINLRFMLEKTVEAISDAGINPASLSKQFVPVMVSNCVNESLTEIQGPDRVNNTHMMLALSLCMQANRTSFCFDFRGPSFMLQNGFLGGMNCLEMAKRMIDRKQCSIAIVASANSIYQHHGSIPFNKSNLNTLSNEGKTRSFSVNADGYCRSEGVVVLVLQRGDKALRSYASIDDVKTETCMEDLSSYMSHESFPKFLKNFYDGSNIDPNEIAYIEANGCGIKKVDLIEVNAINDVVCSKRKDPLLIGSCKGRLGHGEACAPFFSIVNALIAFKTGYIPSTLNYDFPHPEATGLINNRLKVVQEKTALNGDVIAVNMIDCKACYAHIILRRAKAQGQKPNAKLSIPQFILLSGRNANELLKKASWALNEEDPGLVNLVHSAFRTNYARHTLRCYSIKEQNEPPITQVMAVDFAKQPPIWFIFSGMGSQWVGMGRWLMDLPIAERTLRRCHEAIRHTGLDLISIITSTDPKTFDYILNSFVGIAAIQIALVDMLRALGIEPDGMVGHSVGELGCSYGDRCLTAEQVMMAAYTRGMASVNAKLMKGIMAAVGRGYNDMKNIVPPDVDIACHNSATSCTLSGPAETMSAYVEQLKAKGVFAKLVNVANIAYHSRYIKPVAPELLQGLKKVIPNPKMRSKKWLSTCYPESKWNCEEAKYCSAEYHTNNLLSSVLFEEACLHIPEGAVTIEIAPDGLLQAILKRSLSKCTNVKITSRHDKNGMQFFFKALGNLYFAGVDMDLSVLYDKVEYPLPSSTQYLHPLITWNHSEDWPVFDYYKEEDESPLVKYRLKLTDRKTKLFKQDYLINGIPRIPYAHLLAQGLDAFNHKMENSGEPSPVIFTDLVFHQPLRLLDRTMEPYTTVMQSGAFECTENLKLYISGNLKINLEPSDFENRLILSPDSVSLGQAEIYSFLHNHGYYFNGVFKNILNMKLGSRGFMGTVRYRSDLACYIDSIFSMALLYIIYQEEQHIDLKSICTMEIDKSVFGYGEEDVEVFFDSITGKLNAKGISIVYIKTRPVKEEENAEVNIKQQMFIPYSSLHFKDLYGFLQVCSQFIDENTISDSIHLLDLNKCSSLKHFKSILAENTNKKLFECSCTVVDLIVMKTIVESKSKDSTLVIPFEGSVLPQEIIDFLSSNLNCFVLLWTDKVISSTQMSTITCIMDQQLNGHRIMLLKKAVTPPPQLTYVLTSEAGWQQTVHKKLLESQDLCYVISSFSDYYEILLSQNELHPFGSNEKIRWMFIDKKAPAFDQSLPFYSNQIRRDVKVSICRGGVWGSLKNVVFSQLSREAESKHHLHMIDSIESKEVALNYIGVNMTEVVSPTHNHEVGVLEYSGLRSGQAVLGVGRVNEKNEFQPDPILVWNRPAKWTDQQAVTVPLFYSLAYYMLEVLCPVKKGEVVLVHAGYSCLGQATIEVALSRGARVFATYYTDEQKAIIKKRFPQIPDSDIVTCRTMQYLLDIMKSTKGEGVQLAINLLGPEVIGATMAALSSKSKRHEMLGGIYIQVNVDAMKTDTQFGQGVFLKRAGVHGCNPENLLTFNENTKLILKEAVERGIKNNIVKPFDGIVEKGSCSKNKAVQTIVSTSKSAGAKKLIVQIKKMVKEKQMSAHQKSSEDERTFLMIGYDEAVWFNILTLMTNYCRKKIHLVFDRERQSQFALGRLKNFMEKKSKDVSINIYPTNTLSTQSKCDVFIQKVNESGSLEAVFYMKKNNESIYNQTDLALRKHAKDTTLFCISDDVDAICERRRKDNLNAINISRAAKPNWIIRGIRQVFEMGLKSSDTVTLTEHKPTPVLNISEFKSGMEYLPQSIDELIRVGEVFSPGQPEVFELATQSPPFKQGSGVPVAIYIPSFRLDNIERLAKHFPHPMFTMNLPLPFTYIDDNVIIEFAKAIFEKFNNHIIKLICDGAGGYFGMTIAFYLEHCGKSVELFMVDSAPHVVNSSLSWLTGTNLITKYLPLSNKMCRELETYDTWEGQLNYAMSMFIIDETEKEALRKGLNSLMNCLTYLRTFKMVAHQINSVVHFFLPENKSHLGTCEMEVCCKKPISLYIIPNDEDESVLSLTKFITNIMVEEYPETCNLETAKNISKYYDYEQIVAKYPRVMVCPFNPWAGARKHTRAYY